ncbi:MAG: thioredoxin family protein [Burkholderiales bacterium]|jgi:thioredoxin-like negative regulator of GroEL|nr:thioredoxin family protein [Burkholderiales bacterium]
MPKDLSSSRSVFGAPDLSELLTTLKNKRQAPHTTYIVVMLCAEWCGVCRSFLPQVQAWAKRSRQLHDDTYFVYLDIDDHETPASTLDLNDFPTAAVFCNDQLVFFGVIKAREDALRDLLLSLRHTTPASHQETSALLKDVIPALRATLGIGE